MLLMSERLDRTQRLHEAGAWLSEARKSAGLTQAELGIAIGKSSANVSNYERGGAAVPDEVASKVARALGRGEIETRRGLGLYVPGDAQDDDPEEVDVLDAIRRDRRLLPEARRHLLNQYQLLLRVSPGPAAAEEQKEDRPLKAVARGKARAANPKDEDRVSREVRDAAAANPASKKRRT